MSFDWRPCGYGCDKPWRPFAGTRLIGHAKCAAPPAMQDELRALLDQFPRLTIKRLAEDLGVTVSVLLAWLRASDKRHGRRSA